MKKLLPILMAVLALAVAAQGQAVSDEHLIDTQKIRVPAPEGWTNIFPTVEWLAERIAQGEKSGNVAAAAFVPDEMEKRLIAGGRPQVDHYAKFTTPYALLKVDVTPAMFAEFAANEAKKYPAQTGSGTATVNKRWAMLDTIADGEVFITHRTATDRFTGLKLAAETVEGKLVRVLTSSSALRVKGRLILLYVYRPYASAKDVDDLLAFTEKWTAAVAAANEEAK
jgi:hypothetical protein